MTGNNDEQTSTSADSSGAKSDRAFVIHKRGNLTSKPTGPAIPPTAQFTSEPAQGAGSDGSTASSGTGQSGGSGNAASTSSESAT
jgi:hypothetical protein